MSSRRRHAVPCRGGDSAGSPASPEFRRHALLPGLGTIAEFCQQSRGALLRMRGRLIFTPPEEVPMSPSCFTKGLLIAENAG
jgi:hypothetical protein